MTGPTVPPDPGPPPDGMRWVAAIDDRWRPCTAQTPCRAGAGFCGSCGQHAVAELLHAHGGVGRWWAYCPDHMHNHWLQDGHVWGWTLEVTS